MTGVEGSIKQFDLSYNDPNSDSDVLRQAPFVTSTTKLLRLQDTKVIIDDDWYYRFGPDSAGETQRLVDGYLAVYPQLLIAGKGDELTVVTGHDLNNQDGTDAPPAKPIIKIEPSVKEIKIDGDLVDAVAMPLTGEGAYLAKGSDTVQAIVPGAAKPRALGPAPAGTPSATPTPVPNLVIESAHDTQASIRNAGTASAGPFSVTLTRAGDTPLEFRIPGLEASASTSVHYDCRRETRTLSLDPANAVPESDETDNARSFTTTREAPRRARPAGS